MPDCQDSSWISSSRVSTSEAQRRLRALVGECRLLDRLLGALAGSIEEAPNDVLASELRGVVGCVRTDLLADVIQTLEVLSRKTAEDVMRERVEAADVLLQLAGSR